jgi:hypothetical protein
LQEGICSTELEEEKLEEKEEMEEEMVKEEEQRLLKNFMSIFLLHVRKFLPRRILYFMYILFA